MNITEALMILDQRMHRGQTGWFTNGEWVGTPTNPMVLTVFEAIAVASSYSHPEWFPLPIPIPVPIPDPFHPHPHPGPGPGPGPHHWPFRSE